MTTQLDQNNIQPATLAALQPVTITSIQVTDSSWTPIDDSAVSTSGGYIVITGANFISGCNIIISSTNATSVAFVNSTTLRVQVPALSAGTYVVYVVNPNGATAIIVNGLTYSGTPTWVTVSPLTSGVSGSPISIYLNATGDAPLTYAVQAGSTLPDGLTLTSGGLLSGTITGLASETTYNFTVVAIDAQSQDSPKAFSITITAGDQYWDYVTTLLPGTTLTSIFNDDASTNNFDVTVVGDTRPNNFGPYTPGYYSNLFTVATTYLSVPVTASSGDLTIECWIYPTSAPSPTNLVVSSGANDATAWGIAYTTSNTVSFYLGSFGSAVTTSTTTIPFRTWGHIAIVKTSGTVFFYVNGVRLSLSVPQAGVFGSISTALIGSYVLNAGTLGFLGYISNFRYVNGTAMYSGTSFIPPTQPLTNVSGTTVLTCQSNRFINAINDSTITRTGDIRVQGFQPFAVTDGFSSLGSTYFDGTGDYLSVSDNAAFDFTGDFTMEAWVYPNAISTNNGIVAQWTSSLNFIFKIVTSGRPYFAAYPGSTVVTQGTTTAVVVNTWNHIAVTRSGSTIRLFVNGILDATTGTVSGTISGGNPVTIGSVGTAEYLNGYISNLRIVNGTAVYTANFTPPTQPLTAVANTSLLTCQTDQPNNNNVFLDSGTNNFLVTRNGNTTQGSFSPYGSNWSNYFDGTGDYLTAPSNAQFAFGTGAYTVEAWIYLTAFDSLESIIFGSGSTAGGFGFAAAQTGAMLVVKYGTGTIATTNTGIVTLNQWYHVAVSRASTASNNTKFFLNGALVTTTTDSENWTISSAPIIGGWSNLSSYDIYGYISNLRVVKGTAVYTSNFTLPVFPLQPIDGTSLLTCQDNRFNDSSINNFAVTRVGNASVQKFGPFAGTALPTPYYSAYFDGTGDYVATPISDAFTFGTTSFTIEAWVYPVARPSSTVQWIYGNITTATGDTQIGISITTSGTMQLRTWNSVLTVTTSTIPLNAWTHVAAAFDGTTYRLFINGISSASSTTIFTLSTNGAGTVGYNGSQAGNELFTGFISNLRVVKGVALYVANFTPPTQPLTNINGTSLLTCQSNRFIDNSTNNFAITVNGNSQPAVFNPFTVTYLTVQSYSPSMFGGSMYFDGTGDYLSATLAANSVLTLGSDYTIEFWVYFTSLDTAERIPTNCWNSGSGWLFSTQTNAWNFKSTSALVLTYSTVAPTAGQWYHLAATRSGSATNNVKFFINGVQVAQGTNTSILTPATSATGFVAGAGQAGTVNQITGYISDIRIINGTAFYTGNFAPPEAPLTPLASTALLLNGTSAGVYDSSMMNNSETTGNVKISTAISKFGGSSMSFDGTGDWIQVSGTNPSLAFGTGAFTVEFWFYSLAASGTQQLFDTRPAGTVSTAGYMALTYTGNLNYSTADITAISGGAVSANAWHHVALTRSSTSTRLFVDGVQVGSTYTDSQNYLIGLNRPIMGADGNSPSASLNGYMQDIRITSGIARYTANFTAPTTPFSTN
jgi:hypothetical protein